MGKYKRLAESAKVSIGNFRFFFDFDIAIEIRQFLDFIDRRHRENIVRAFNNVADPVRDENGTMASLYMLSAPRKDRRVVNEQCSHLSVYRWSSASVCAVAIVVAQGANGASVSTIEPIWNQ